MILSLLPNFIRNYFSSKPLAPNTRPPFHNPTLDEQFYHRFLAIYLPFSKYLFLFLAYLVLVAVLIPISFGEFENLKTLPPSMKSTLVSAWHFPSVYFCYGHVDNVELQHEVGCESTWAYSGKNASNEHPCEVHEIHFNKEIFDRFNQAEDRCFSLEVQDRDAYNTSLETKFYLKQNMKLPVVNQRSELTDLMLEMPSGIKATFFDPRNNNISRNAFQIFPASAKQTVLFQEELEDRTYEFDAKNPHLSLANEISYTVAKQGAVPSQFSYQYNIYTGQVGRYGFGAICFPFNATHDDCSTHFESTMRIETISDSDYRLKRTIISTQSYWMTFAGSVAGKFTMGQTIIFFIVALFEVVLFRYCYGKKKERDANLDLYKRLQYLHEKKPQRLNQRLAELENELLDESEKEKVVKNRQ